MPVGLVVRVHGRVGLRVRQAAVAPTVAPLLHGQAPVGHQREAVAFEGPRLLQLRNGILLAALTGLLVGPHELRDLPDPVGGWAEPAQRYTGVSKGLRRSRRVARAYKSRRGVPQVLHGSTGVCSVVRGSTRVSELQGGCFLRAAGAAGGGYSVVGE